MSSRRWNNTTKVIVIVVLAILALILVATFRALIPATIVALLLAFVLSYPVNWLQRQTGWARSTAVAALYAVILTLLLLAPALIIPRALSLSLALRDTLESLIESLQGVSTGFLLTLGDLHLSPDTMLQQVGDGLQNVLLATANPLSIFRGVSSGVLQTVYVLVLNFWLLVDLQKLRRALFEQIPLDYQEDARQLAEELGETWQAFLRGQTVLALVFGLITWIPLAIVGMPNAGGLALLAGVMEFLPNIGQGISGTIAVMMALFQGSTWLPVNNLAFALIVLVIYSIIAQIENVYLVPRLVGGRVKLHPAVAFMGTVAGALVFGVLGVLLATPVIASGRIIFTYIYRKLLDQEPFQPAHLAQAAMRIPGLVGGRKIEAVVFELDGTLAAPDWGATGWAVSYFYWLERVAPAAQRREIARRMLVMFEGAVNFLLSQLHRFHLDKRARVQRILPILDSLRGYPPVATLRPLPVTATLAQLTADYRCALISMREPEEVAHFLRCAGLEQGIFEVVLTRAEVRNLLPRSEGLALIAERMALQPNQMLMVSDTDVNLRAARAMEMATAGVLTGLGVAEEMREADLVLASVADLTEWL